MTITTTPLLSSRPRFVFKLSQKDCDAEWTKKNGVTFFGYKNHVKADAESVLLTDYQVTGASVHDSQLLPDLIGPQNKDENLFADSAYKSAHTDKKLAEWGIGNWIHEKGARNRPLNELHKGLNQLKSKVRCCIEHIIWLCREQYERSGTRIYRTGEDRDGHWPEQPRLQPATLHPIDPAWPGALGPARIIAHKSLKQPPSSE